MFTVVGPRLSSSFLLYNARHILMCFASLRAGSVPCGTSFTVIPPEVLPAGCELKNSKAWFLSVWEFSMQSRFLPAISSPKSSPV